ncbi:MAG TPA: ABC-type transport auxiliary lipoprotein family protein [Micropepsaceae bacterium]
MSKAAGTSFNRRTMILGAGASLLSGCGSIQLIPQPMQPQLYVLRPAIPAAMGARVPWRLSVAPADAPASLDTARIALSRSTNTMDYFANAAWNDRVPLIVQRLLIEAFDASNRIVAVDRDSAGTENDYLLQTEIRDFEARYAMPDGAPEIVISIEAKLTRTTRREIVNSLNVMQRAQAPANNLDSIVSAFNSAAGAAVAQIAAWTLDAPAPPAG